MNLKTFYKPPGPVTFPRYSLHGSGGKTLAREVPPRVEGHGLRLRVRG